MLFHLARFDTLARDDGLAPSIARTAPGAAWPGRRPLGYRTIVRRYGYRQLPLRVTVDMVLAGFGLFAVLGGFSVDRLSLRGLGADPKGARDSILALGLTEIVTLAAVAFVTSIAFLAGGSAVPGSMLWPWAISVPGAGLVVTGLLVSARRRPQTFGVRVQHITTRGWLMMRILGDLARLPLAWCGIGLYFVADITSLYAAIHAVGLRLGVGAVLIAYASGYLFSRRTLPLASAAFAEALLTFSVPALASRVAPPRNPEPRGKNRTNAIWCSRANSTISSSWRSTML
jgi:hypothetical protein